MLSQLRDGQIDRLGESSGLQKEQRIFSLRGCHLIAMFAKTVIAKQFRVWVLDILDKEVNHPKSSNPLPNALSEILSANLTPAKKMVMLNIVNKADKNGQFQMGVLDLAHLCGIAKSTIIETVSSLEQLGFLTIMRTRASNGGSNPNLYTIPERFRFVSGELVDEPIAIEYQPPKGMMLIAESEFKALKKAPAPVVQKVEPIAAGCVVIPIKDYDGLKASREQLKTVKNYLDNHFLA